MEEILERTDREAEAEEGIDLRELCRVLLAKIWWIVLATVVFAAGAFGYTELFVEPWYESEAALYVVSNNMTSSSDVTVANFLARDCIALIEDHNMLNKALELLRERNVAIDPKMTYKELGKKLTLSLSDSESRLILVKVTDGDPAIAKAIADAICEVARTEVNETIGGDRGEGRINPVGGASPATLPEKKAGPSRLNNMLLSGAVGMILSTGLIVLFYVLDDKIKNADQVQQILGLSTLGTIPHQKRSAAQEQ